MQQIQYLRDQLAQTHDVPNTQTQCYQVATDPTLALTPGQRGALNYISAQPHATEEYLSSMLDHVQRASGSLTVPSPHAAVFDVPVFSTFEPIVKQAGSTYQWSLVTDSVADLILDATPYSSPVEAQKKAEAFISQLHQGHEKAWIHMGLVFWTQQTRSLQFSCQAELIHIHKSYYVLVVSHIGSPLTLDMQNQKTVHFTHKVLALEQWVNPTWVARGFIPHGPWFYILYKVNEPLPGHTLTDITRHLGHIVCQ